MVPRQGIFFISLLLSFGARLPLSAQHEEPTLAWFNGFFQEKLSAEELSRNAENKLSEAKTNGMPAKEAMAYTELGLIHLTRVVDYERAMEFFIHALAIEDSLNLEQQRVFTYLAISRTFEKVGDYAKSSQVLEQAMTLNEKHHDISVLVFILNELGKINAAQGRVDAAFENYELALDYAKQLEQPEVEATALFNLGHLYTIQGKYDQALNHHKQALALRRSADDALQEASSLNDIGELYRLMDNSERALANHKVALELRQKLDDKDGLAESYNNIGVLYYQQENISRAVANLELGLQAAREAHGQNEMRKSFEFLSLCHEKRGEFEKALQYKSELVSITEFIYHENSERQVLETQSRYVIEKHEASIERLETVRTQREKELANQRNFIQSLIAIIVLGTMMIWVIVYLYLGMRRTNRNLIVAKERIEQQNNQLQDLNATKDKFFSIISHDLKGPLNSLTSFSSLLINHTDSLSKEEIQMLAKDLDKNLKNLFALLENLLEWSRSQTGGTDFAPENFDLFELLKENVELLDAQAQNKRVSILCDDQRQCPLRAHRHSINTVVRNLISNAIKFTPEGGTIALDVKHGNGEVVVSVADTGVGMSEDVLKKLFRLDTKHSTKGTANEKGTGLGLILCKDFVEKNGGRLWVESDVGKGSTFYFTVPVRRDP